MKILCGERVLDLSRMNEVAPDGAHVWVQVQPYSYAPERLPANASGTYLLTSDRGAVHIGDMAFKVLADLAAYSGTCRMRYLLQDISRGAEASEGGWEPAAVPDGAMKSFLDSLGLKAVHMPCTDKVLTSSLRALQDPADMALDIGRFLSGYIYVEHMSVAEVHGALTELLQSFSAGDFVSFLETVYGILSGDVQPEEAPQAEAGDDGTGEGQQEAASARDAADAAKKVNVTEGGEGRSIVDAAAIASGGSAADLRDSIRVPGGTGLFTSGRRLKGSDITGTDETFTLEYYDKFYKDGLEKADASGFADRLIKARAGEGMSPVAVLGEAIGKMQKALLGQAESGTDASNLRDQLVDLAEQINKAAEGMKPGAGQGA